MSRWLKFLLLGLVVAGAVLISLPWWLGAALRPVLRARGITFDRYERVGYARFQLRGVHFASPGFSVTAGQVQATTPLVWLGQRLRGAEPTVMIVGWRIDRLAGSGAALETAGAGLPRDGSPESRPKAALPATESGSPDQPPIAGLPDLQAALHRLGPRVGYWLPRAHLSSGELRGFGPVVTIAQADWSKTTLSVEGLQVADQTIAFVLAPTADGSVLLTAHTAGNAARMRLAWSGAELKGEAVLWDQPAQLSAHFPATGWLPAAADLVAENWRLPAGRVKLGAPYTQVLGSGRLTWRDAAFEISLNARAEPAVDTKAPTFAASATAQGNLRELTLATLLVDAPFATARLSAPITFSRDHPPAGASARLSVQADLAQLPWFEAKGKVEGAVTVAGRDAALRQEFSLTFADVAFRDFSAKSGQARGVLQWPQVELTELKVQLDDASSLAAHGALNWQTRELTGVALTANLAPVSFARWLPAGVGWEKAELTATAEGPLTAPRHQGSLKLSAAHWPPLQPLTVDATWQGVGARLEVSTHAQAGKSTLAFAGTLDPAGLLLAKLQFAPAGQPGWELVAPAQVNWTPFWRVDNLRLAGPASQLTFKGQGGAESFLALTATRFESSWLQDWLTLTGPGWQVQSLQTTGQVADGVMVLDLALIAQIEMSPQPARVNLRARADAQGVKLQEFTVTEAERVLTQATGRLPLVWRTEPTLHLSLDEDLPFELSAKTEPDSPLWTTLAGITGLSLTGPTVKIELTGTLRHPAGELQAQAVKISVAPDRIKFPLPEISDLTLSMQLGRDLVTVRSFAAKLDGQPVQASGRLPMDDDHWQQLWRQPLAFDWRKAEARIEIPDADLAPTARRFPAFVAAQGRLRATVELKSGGAFTGELHLKDAASRPLPPYGTLQEIQADLTFADRTITVQKLTATLGGEPVTLTGNATLGPGGTPHFALNLQGKNLPLVRNTGLLLRLDVDLHANTGAAGVTTLGGTVAVRDCLMLASLNLRDLLPSGTRGVMRPPPYFSVATEPFRHWALAVDLRAAKTVRLRTTVFHVTASGRFRLDGTLGEPRALGELAVDQGQLLFPFATFKVQTGTVRLREADPFHAIVNLSGTSQRRDYQLRLEATGDLAAPNVQLSSTPALDASALTLLVMTGQPPVGEGTASSGQRLALLGAYLSRGLFQDLGLGGEERLEISAGERVSEQGRDTYEFEYKLGERSSLLGEYDRFDSYNAGLKWHVYNQESVPSEKK